MALHVSQFLMPLATVLSFVLLLLSWKSHALRTQHFNALRTDREKYRQLFENAHDAILVISGGRFHDCNNALLALFHIPSREQLLQLDGLSISATLQRDGMPAWEGIATRFSLAQTDAVQRFEWLFRRWDGEVFPAEVTMSAMQLNDESVIHLVIRDITEQRQHHHFMRLATKVFESATEGILVTDEHARILHVNDAFTKITGYSADEVLGSTPRILSSGRQNKAFYTQLWQHLHTEGQWQGEIWNRRKNGEIYPEWLAVSRLPQSGEDNEYFVAVFSDISERKKTEESIYFHANHDALTNLPNRTLFRDRLEQALAFARRLEQKKVALLFIDLDRFKLINDTLGHDAGDVLLRQIALRLQQTVRESDTVARLGGDEFTILLPDVDNENVALHIAQKVLDRLQEPVRLAERDYFVSASIGISFYPDDGEDADTLMKHADTAMYQVKGNGRSGLATYTPDLSHLSSRRMEIENGLYEALQQNQFSLAYQPQLNLKTGHIRGAEVLLRWHHPQLGPISPAEFIPIAEDTGLIAPISNWVVQQVCAQASLWQNQGWNDFIVSINLSPRQFVLQDIPGMIASMADPCLALHLIEMEITETIAMDDSATATTTLQQLASMGVRLAIDDFGTGYSSLSQLKRVPVETLKIDRSFIQDIVVNPDDLAITSAIITMAHQLGMSVIAEGVETQLQLNLLTEMGVDIIQGYHYSKPLETATMQKWLDLQRAPLSHKQKVA